MLIGDLTCVFSGFPFFQFSIPVLHDGSVCSNRVDPEEKPACA